MKKHIIIVLSLVSALNGMEKQIVIREPREWDAKAYDEGSTIQTQAFLQFLATNKINTEKRTILDVGCGTGKITAALAKKAQSIHGFDASKNMTDYAHDKYHYIKNLSFEHCFAEDFQSPKLYQLAIASFCIHWFENQKLAFQRINDSLEENGDFFATVQTSNNPAPLNLVAAQEKIEGINKASQWLMGKDIIDLTACSLPSNQELKIMLAETGFEIIKNKEQSFEIPMTKDEIIKTERPIVFSRPIVQYIPSILIEPFFNDYIDLYISKLHKVSDDKYLEKIVTTIIHARKVKK